MGHHARTEKERAAKQVCDLLEEILILVRRMPYTSASNIRKLIEVAESIARADMHPNDRDSALRNAPIQKAPDARS